jgi:hypothetical protein
MKYSNPRKQAIIQDWPIGGNARGSAIFKIEANKRGERATRETEKRNGTWGKPKLGTYAQLTRIVDGDDGRTYVMSYGAYDMISIMRGDMKYSEETIHRGDERFEETLAMLKGGE